ncbi:dTDP-4-dehydrorhamnose reductase [Jeotgalibacillus sp. R-1-5s-1]|uniref:dTDP-4-dehydrorhamnose reductase n=1 Tax=Jeotgalibacillus sp. R-1-5s-1 TaxID=2555897 RepID=UPI00106C6091|nr:dTDP-4-dehydrorhamnose reductase [Jeotgalibacillus sp. R-1-5s-1]TFE00027.1 dTDP-4-dehydrorhamnose reductase [Jeotgalibacillus sp. R-1-5s-1]
MDTLKVLVTGSRGQLGKEIYHVLEKAGHQVIGLGRQQLDITISEDVLNTFKKYSPDVVIHAAAYTDVNNAENEQEEAFKVNGAGTKNVALAVHEIKAKLVYVSTDYIFNGASRSPIPEDTEPSPLSVYGQSKLEGEKYVKEILEDFFIVRTSWLYGQFGNNFVKKMLEAGDRLQKVTVVDDQFGSPTYTGDLAEAIAKLIMTDKYGTYHLSNSGSCSWYEFAKKIFELADKEVTVVPCKTEEFKSPAKRPEYSILEHGKWKGNGFEEIRHWSNALEDFLTHYLISS